jgi:hypothetical protein
MGHRFDKFSPKSTVRINEKTGLPDNHDILHAGGEIPIPMRTKYSSIRNMDQRKSSKQMLEYSDYGDKLATSSGV